MKKNLNNYYEKLMDGKVPFIDRLWSKIYYEMKKDDLEFNRKIQEVKSEIQDVELLLIRLEG